MIKNALQFWTDKDWQNRAKLRKGFEEHYDRIRKLVPKERLLEYNVKEGWEPLCNFLGEPVPAEPLPRLNSGEYLMDAHYLLFWFRVVMVSIQFFKRAIPVVVAIGAGVYYFRAWAL